MRAKILAAAAALAVAAAVVVSTSAGSTPAQQRIAIVFHPRTGTFVLSPLSSGAITRDAGTYSSCCWTRHLVTRDGESMEVDQPTVSFTSNRGTFVWHERITFVDISSDYTVGTAVWKITHGTGAYAHLSGHGREASVGRTAEQRELAAKAQGLLTLGS